MKNEVVKAYTHSFNNHSQTTDSDIEFWFARDLQHLLGYAEWRNFNLVISKAKIACEATRNRVLDHFVDINKMVVLGSGSERKIQDIMLTRYACYLIAQNGNPKKNAIAFAQNYFARQTRKLELIEKRLEDFERLQARQKLAHSEKELSQLIFEHTHSERNFGIIRSKGDTALFGGHSTQKMKGKLRVPNNRALADFLPAITIKAKDFSTEITVFNTKQRKLITETQITREHIKNNKSVRSILLERGIKPEDLPAEEDIKKMERRLLTGDKKVNKNPDKLKSSNE